ncbi:MAG: hypothetical protein PHX09_01080 [Clostridia bacterium]|nr:hypothetical protein [Clostridia bacterium]MDD4686061.1 hypothetical protein [Clostridia bacterium]
MIYNKSVVLSAVDNSLKKAVLNLDGKTGGIRGDVKLYNFIEEPMGVLSLGLLIDGKVHKAGLTRVGYMTYTFGSILNNIPENCTCALISSRGGSSEPLLLGSISGNGANMEERLISGLNALEQTSPKIAGNILQENSIYFDDDEDIEKEVDNYFRCNEKCENCTYKSAFYKNGNKANEDISLNETDSEDNVHINFDSDEDIYDDIKYDEGEEVVDEGEEVVDEVAEGIEEVQEKEKKSEKKEPKKTKEKDDLVNDTVKNIKSGKMRKPTLENSIYFFDEISSQLEILFDKHSVDEVLCDIIPNSKWVKVDYEKEGKFYVVGLIYSEDVVKYVCYGFPASWTEKPPVDFNEKAQWLPIDVAEPKGQGYWITYQDAQDGEIVRVDII